MNSHKTFTRPRIHIGKSLFLAMQNKNNTTITIHDDDNNDDGDVADADDYNDADDYDTLLNILRQQ